MEPGGFGKVGPASLVSPPEPPQPASGGAGTARGRALTLGSRARARGQHPEPPLTAARGGQGCRRVVYGTGPNEDSAATASTKDGGEGTRRAHGRGVPACTPAAAAAAAAAPAPARADPHGAHGARAQADADPNSGGQLIGEPAPGQHRAQSRRPAPRARTAGPARPAGPAAGPRVGAPRSPARVDMERQPSLLAFTDRNGAKVRSPP